MTLDARFRIPRGEFTLDAQLSIPDRGVTALYGPSGCGKTTLLRAVAGLERDPDGYLAIAGECWQDDQLFVPPHRRSVGFVFQEPSLFPHLSVRQNLEYGFRRVPAERRRTGVAEVVALLGLGGLQERDPAELSGGERQRVAIARALLANPSLLLLDEPLTGLDAAGKADILPYLESLHSELEIPIVYVTHATDEVARLADHLVLMELGRIVAAGPIAEMLTRFDLPLSHGREAEALVEAEVLGHDATFHLTRLGFDTGEFLITREALAVGTRVRLRVLARDVSLTLQHQTDTSILNILPVTVVEIAEEGEAQVMVKLLAGRTHLLSRITRRSAKTLDLGIGKTLFAQIKTVALLA